MPLLYPTNWSLVSGKPKYTFLIGGNTISRLKPIDVEFMRQLHTKVNLIPVIAKADTLTDEEVADFKARVSLAPCVISFTQLRFDLT